MKKFLIWAFGILIILYFVGKCGRDTSTATSMTRYSETDTPSLQDPASSIPVENSWNYSEVEDKMGSSKTFYAEIQANELLDFEFPYNGGQTATLVVRKKRGETNVYVKISKGQFNNSFNGGNISIKFDNNPPRIYSYSGAADGSSDIIFIDNESRLITNLKKYKKLLIEAEFYNEGLRVMEFNIKGFNWKR